MKDIKFRGVTAKGETVYGDLVRADSKTFIGGVEVETDSVAQFAFTDNDVDYYEGDTFRKNGRIFAAQVLPYFEELFSDKSFPDNLTPLKDCKPEQLSLF